MTDQEAFDKAATHLLQQGCRSEEADLCCYRGPNGTKCAIGVLIPDEEYYPGMEGLSADLLYCPSLEDVNSNLLLCLQGVHDDRAPETWASELRQLADNWHLSTKNVPRL